MQTGFIFTSNVILADVCLWIAVIYCSEAFLPALEIYFKPSLEAFDMIALKIISVISQNE